MNTHPDVMWILVKDRQARLRQEAEQQKLVSLVTRAAAGARRAGAHAARRAALRRPAAGPGRPVAGAGTLAACAPGVAE